MLSTKIVIAFALSGTLAGVTVIAPSAGAGASANGGVRASAAAGVQVIDANTDPAGAGKVLNDFCDPASKCQFAGSVQPKVAYDEPRTICDALYNCGSSYAADSVEISDERSQSTSLEESLSTKVTLGILTSELEATTKQLQKVSTTTGATQEVSVAPGGRGGSPPKSRRPPSLVISRTTRISRSSTSLSPTRGTVTMPSTRSTGRVSTSVSAPILPISTRTATSCLP